VRNIKRKAAFLDRDGVITQDPPHYAHRVDQLRLIPNSAQAIRLLNEYNFKVIVISNQSGIARGYYPEKETHIFNKALKNILQKENADIDAFYYCPHHPEAKIKKYRIECNCRKPNPGMIEKASNDYNIDLSQSYMIGDRLTDILAGKKGGCKTIHVLTGVGQDQLSKYKIDADFSSKNLYEAVEKIILNKDK
jgi:D-glycero-D-manno-heptose 1,7-bisphosphate phosphatase